MSDTVRAVQYFKMQVAHKPGEGARLLNIFKEAGVNLFACLGFPRNRRAQVDFVPEDPVAFTRAAKQAKLKIGGPKTCFLIEGEDRIGAVAEHANKLTKAKVNIHAVAAVSAGAGRYGVILWVKPKDVRKTAKALEAS